MRPFLTVARAPRLATAQGLLKGGEPVGSDRDCGASQYPPLLKKYATSSDLHAQIKWMGCMVRQDGLPVSGLARGVGWVIGHVQPSDGVAFDDWFPDGMLDDPKTGKIFTLH